MLDQRNKIKPEYFFRKVAEKMNLPTETVRDIYTKYLTRVREVIKHDAKVMLKGLGSFEIDQDLALSAVIMFMDYLEYNEAVFPEGEELTPYEWFLYDRAIRAVKNLHKIKSKYEYVKRYLEEFPRNYRRFEEFFDNKGNSRTDFKRKDRYLQQLPIQLDQCAELCGVQRETREELQD